MTIGKMHAEMIMLQIGLINPLEKRSVIASIPMQNNAAAARV
jgi:hypothetical protein